MTGRWCLRPGFIAIVAATICSNEGIAQDTLPQTTNDGLELTDSRFVALYWRSGATLGQYRRVVLLDPLVQFRDNWLEDENRGRLASTLVTDDDMTRITEGISEEFLNVFTEELEDDDGYEIVNVAAADVLLLRPAILNLDTGADTFGSARASAESTSLAMTLYLEFYDSATSTTIGRALDNKSRPDTDRPAVRRIVRNWARNVRDMLENASD